MQRFIDLIDSKEYDYAVNKMREFFRGKGFFEAGVQHRLSILAACEDPTTISNFDYSGKVWPMPQTGQMWLERELLENPDAPGFYCITTSYRNEPDPVEGRHNLIFPMFEFEHHGGIDELIALERDLLEFLGFGAVGSFPRVKYEAAAKLYEVEELDHEHEASLETDFGIVTLLTHFPERTSPFWNMRVNPEDPSLANKVDVILYGVETIGSAERSIDPEEMRDKFHTISEGMYAKVLYKHFGTERVERELEDFLAYDFFPRSGGGIGVTRMISAMKKHGLMPKF